MIKYKSANKALKRTNQQAGWPLAWRYMNMKILIPLIFTLLYTSLINAEEIVLKTEKDKVEQIRVNKAIPTGRFDGTVKITQSTGYLTMPTRIVFGLFHDSPRTQEFQLVIEQIEE